MPSLQYYFTRLIFISTGISQIYLNYLNTSRVYCPKSALIMNFGSFGGHAAGNGGMPNRQYNPAGMPSQHHPNDDFDNVDFNAIATGQRKPAAQQSKGRISSNRVASMSQKNNNFGAIQQTSMHQYDVSQMSTQSQSRNAAKYHTQSKGSVSNHQLQQTSQLSTAYYPEENNLNNDDRIHTINSPMTFGNSPVNQRNNPNYMNGQAQNMNQYADGNLPHKFKRKSLYNQVRVDMNDHNFNGIEKIEEEPESLVQTPHDMNHPNDALDVSPENQRSLGQKIARPSAFIDSTPRIAPIHELPKEEDRKSPTDFARIPEIKIENACEDSEDGIHIGQLLPPLDDRSRANNFNKTKKSVATIATNRIDPIKQPNFNNSFTKGVHNETGRSGQVASVRPDMGDQDTYEKESTAWKRIESTQQSLYISKHANHKGGDAPQPTEEDVHQNTQSFAPHTQKQNASVKFQDINHRNPGNKPFMKKTPLNEQAFQKEAAVDDESQENSFEAYDPPEKFVVESNSVRTRQQYLAQQEKAPSEQMFDQSSIVNRQQLDITDVNMNTYFPPTQQNAVHGDGRRGPRPTQVKEPQRYQKMAQRPSQPKPGVLQTMKHRKSESRKEKGISHNKMYSHLYKNLVPNTIKQGHRISNPDTVGPHTLPKRQMAVSHNSVSPYKNYVTKLNQYLDKNDKLLQVDLKNRNQDFLERNTQFHDEKERVLTERQQHKMLEDRYKEMENCSFKPQINKNSDRIAQRMRAPAHKTSEVDIPDEFIKNGQENLPTVRSADNFYKSEMKFVERHEKWREDVIKNEMTNFKQGVKSKKISKNSEMIWENSVKRKSVVTNSGVSVSQGRLASSIGTSPESKLGYQGPFSDNQGDRQRLASINSNRSCKSSKSIQDFLNRNYHSIQDKKKAVITRACEKVNINLQRQRAQETQRYRTIKSVSPNAESVASGSSKGSSPQRSKFMDRKFKPTLSQKSVQLSLNRRANKDVFSALHAEKQQLQEERSKLEQDDIQKYKSLARQKILRNVNETSASQLADRFEKEFNKIYKNQLDQGPTLYLLDVLEDLKFLDNEQIGNNFAKIELLLANNKQNLLIDLDDNKDKIFSIKQNFCEICLGIQNLSSNYKPHPPIDDRVLKYQLGRLKRPMSTPEEIIIEQIMVLREIISRPAFNLTSRQINLINNTFNEFNMTRRNLTFEEKRLGRYQKAVEAEMSKYQDMPKITPHPTQYQMKQNTSEVVPNNRDLVSVQNSNQRGRNVQQQSRNGPAGQSRSLSKASSGSRYNSEKLYMHAQRQKQYKKELKEWYDKKDLLEQQHDLVFSPKLNPVSLHLAQKREKSVIEHAQDYAKASRVDLDTNYVEYMKSKDQCTFKPQTVKNLVHQNVGKENMVQNFGMNPTPKPLKQTSGITASTNFGSGVSANDMDNNSGSWINKFKDFRDQNNDLDSRISPEMRVKAQIPQKNTKSNHKSNPMSKYVSAHNSDDESDPINVAQTSRTHKNANMQQFLDLSPEQSGSPQKNNSFKQTQSMNDLHDRPNSGKKPIGSSRSLLQDELKKPQSSCLPPSGILRPSKSALNTRVGNLQKMKSFQYHSMLPTVEEPICVLKIELDGRNIEEIKVFENDNPEVIVQEFGENFNLSQNAMQRLLDQINEQIQMDENSFQ